MSRRVTVVGGGIAGAVAALRLAQAGASVTVVERGDRLGGLVASFEIGGTPIERFYHHVFPQEREVIGLIGEAGLADRLEWRPSSIGMFTDGRWWPFTSAADLLRFRPLPLLGRLRAGVGALRLGRVRKWEALDTVPALDWLRRYTGPQAVAVVWGPLLAAKFGPAAGEVPAAWMWGRFQQRAGARANGGERLGYLRGGFRQVFDWLGGELARLGAELRTGSSVHRIRVTGGAVTGVELEDGTSIAADDVVFAGPLPALAGLVPPSAADPRWAATGALGVLCVVLETRRPVTAAYWTNVCDPALPFGGLIEQTNLVPPSDYGGHVVYLSRYFLADEPIATADPDEEAARWVEDMAARWPGFSTDDVVRAHAFRAPYAAPLVTVGHLGRIAPMRSHIDGLVVATTAQIYPQDRGMSEGVRIGGEAAAAVLSRAPVSRPRA